MGGREDEELQQSIPDPAPAGQNVSAPAEQPPQAGPRCLPSGERVDPQVQARPFAGLYDGPAPGYGQAPAQIELPPAVQVGVQGAADVSRDTGKEACGVAIQGADGRIRWQNSPQANPSSTACVPDRSVAGPGETIPVAGHSHASYNPPSGIDVANRLQQPEPVHVVQNLDGNTYAIAKTREFEERAARLTEPERAVEQEQIKKDWDQTYQDCERQQGTNEGCHDRATEEVLRQQKLRYYRGRAGQPLDRVD